MELGCLGIDQARLGPGKPSASKLSAAVRARRCADLRLKSQLYMADCISHLLMATYSKYWPDKDSASQRAREEPAPARASHVRARAAHGEQIEAGATGRVPIPL